LVDTGDTEVAADRLEQLYRRREEPFESGSVAIVGAGPGSHELLTLRALDRIQRADVILHDALVGHEVLDLALPGTRVIDVGRRSRDAEPAPAENSRGRSSDITAYRIDVMIREVRAGKRVVRLHGGDPFVFGRGDEEVDALAEAGIPFEVVPGVSSVLAAPAAAQIPLTRRGVAKGFTVRVGRDSSGPTSGDLPLSQETVVVLMGLGAIDDVMDGLVAEGRDRDTPAVVVSCASRVKEQVVVGTLATLAAEVRAAKLESPETLIVGDVAHRLVQDRSVDSPWSGHVGQGVPQVADQPF
jgi:uroporphyrin-III C-methyltransferase